MTSWPLGTNARLLSLSPAPERLNSSGRETIVSRQVRDRRIRVQRDTGLVRRVRIGLEEAVTPGMPSATRPASRGTIGPPPPSVVTGTNEAVTCVGTTVVLKSTPTDGLGSVCLRVSAVSRPFQMSLKSAWRSTTFTVLDAQLAKEHCGPWLAARRRSDQPSCRNRTVTPRVRPSATTRS